MAWRLTFSRAYQATPGIDISKHPDVQYTTLIGKFPNSKGREWGGVLLYKLGGSRPATPVKGDPYAPSLMCDPLYHGPAPRRRRPERPRPGGRSARYRGYRLARPRLRPLRGHRPE